MRRSHEVLLDENFPKAAGDSLKKAGHEVFDFRGGAEEGMTDSELFEKAQVLGAILLRDSTWLAYPSLPS